MREHSAFTITSDKEKHAKKDIKNKIQNGIVIIKTHCILHWNDQISERPAQVIVGELCGGRSMDDKNNDKAVQWCFGTRTEKNRDTLPNEGLEEEMESNKATLNRMEEKNVARTHVMSQQRFIREVWVRNQQREGNEKYHGKFGIKVK